MPAAGQFRLVRPGSRPVASAVISLLAAVGLTAMGLPAASIASAAPPSPAPGATSSPTPPTTTGSPDQVTWSIEPASEHQPDGRPTYNYSDFAPGSAREDFVAIDNFSDKPLTLAVYPSDAFNTATGGFDVLTAKENSTDVGSWIRLAQSQVEVDARSTMIIPFTIAVPLNATPGFHVGGVIASLTSLDNDASGSNVLVDRRVGVRMFLQVPGELQPKLEIQNLKVNYHGGWDPIHGGSASITYTVANTGNVPLEAHQAIDTKGLLGVFGRTSNGPDLPLLLPGNSIPVTTTISGIWPGIRLEAAVHLDPFTSIVTLDTPPVEASASWHGWALPWTWLIALAALVLLVVASYRYRSLRRRRRAIKASVDRESTDAMRTGSADRVIALGDLSSSGTTSRPTG